MVLGTTKTFAQSGARGLPELIRLFTVSGRSPPNIAERERM